MEPTESITPEKVATPLRVVLVDDFAPFRQTIASHLNGTFQLIGQANDGSQAIDLARSLHPDLILMDNRMQEKNGISAIGQVLEAHPKVAIFITSLSFERNYVLRALAAGARGYIAKDDAVDSLGAIAEATRSGRPYVSPSVSALIDRTAPPNPPDISRQVQAVFDREAPALMDCARRVADPVTADAALTAAFFAYWVSLRKLLHVPDPQTWLLISLAGLLFPGDGDPKRWSFFQQHPGGRDLRKPTPRLLEHVSACGACHLSWVLASYDPRGAAEVGGVRSALTQAVEHPDETALFLAFADRQAGVMRMAESELKVLLGSDAGQSWMQRELSASTWLGALLGRNPAETSA